MKASFLTFLVSVILTNNVVCYAPSCEKRTKMEIKSMYQDEETIVNDRSVKYSILSNLNFDQPPYPLLFCYFTMDLVNEDKSMMFTPWKAYNDTAVLAFEVETTYLHQQAHPSVLSKPLSRITATRPGWTIDQEIIHDVDEEKDCNHHECKKLSFRFEIGVRKEALKGDYFDTTTMRPYENFASSYENGESILDVQVLNLPSHTTTLHEITPSMKTAIMYIYEGELMSIDGEAGWYMQGSVIRLENANGYDSFSRPGYLRLKTGGIGSRVLILLTGEQHSDLDPLPSTATDFPPTTSKWNDHIFQSGCDNQACLIS